MKDSKMIQQLSLRLEDVRDAISPREVAGAAHISESQLSNIRHGRRAIPKDVKKSVVHKIWGWCLAFSAARSEFGIPSFLDNPNFRQTPFVTSTTQEREQSERVSLEPAYRLAISKKPEKRTAEDLNTINRYFREYLEEIGSEESDWAVKAKDANLTDQEQKEIIDEYNQQLGG